MGKKEKKKFRPRIELLIILVFFLSFIMWAVSKCNAKKMLYQEPLAEQVEIDPIDSLATESNNEDIPTSESNNQAKSNNATSEASKSPVVQTKIVNQTKLYVTIEGMKLRRGPSLDSAVILTMPLFDEVIFLNEVSDSTEIISLGNDIMANDPWVKVKHWKGHTGWIYGAGVHYYKIKYPGFE